MAGEVIVFDFEVWKYDWFMGYKIMLTPPGVGLDGTPATYTEPKFIHTVEELKSFYYDNVSNIWVGHNIGFYDLPLMDRILKGEDPKSASDSIISGSTRYHRFQRPVIFYDTFTQPTLFAAAKLSLKEYALRFGLSGYETPIDFDLDRSLTDEEWELAKQYNIIDLDVTGDILHNHYHNNFMLKLQFCNQYTLPYSNIKATWGTLASKALTFNSWKWSIQGGRSMKFKPELIEHNLKLGDHPYYETILNKLKMLPNISEMKKIGTFVVGGLDHELGEGGCHGAQKHKAFDHVWFADVASYYVVLQILYGMLSRTISDPGDVEYWVDLRLALKAAGDPGANVYKQLLVTLYGITKYEGSPFYDPEQQLNIAIAGQLFIYDLILALEQDYTFELVQSNTDGIAFMCKDIKQVQVFADKWQERTGFELEYTFFDKLYQKDVNNYIGFIYDDDYRRGILTPKNTKVKGAITNKLFLDSLNFQNRTNRWLSIGLARYLAYDELDISHLDAIDLQIIVNKVNYDYLMHKGKNIGKYTRAFHGHNGAPLYRVKHNAKYTKSDMASAKNKAMWGDDVSKWPPKKVVKDVGLGSSVICYNHDIHNLPDSWYARIDYDIYYDSIVRWAAEFGKQ